MAFFFAYLLYLFVEAPFNSLISSMIQSRIPQGLKRDTTNDHQPEANQPEKKGSKKSKKRRNSSSSDSDSDYDEYEPRVDNNKNNLQNPNHHAIDMNGNENPAFENIEIGEIRVEQRRGA